MICISPTFYKKMFVQENFCGVLSSMVTNLFTAYTK